jgi:hypothetical protein
MATDLYAKVPLSVRADSESAFCFPGATVPVVPLTLIVYFHGMDAPSIGWYLKQKVSDLKSVVENASATVVLAAPSLTRDAQAGDDFALKTYLPALGAALKQKYPDLTLPDLGQAGSYTKIILAAHSGGGKVMLATAQKKADNDGFTQKIAECWGFDCLYGPLEQNAVTVPASDAADDAWQKWELKQHNHRELQWATWLGANGGVKFFLYWTDQGGTKTRSENLKKLAGRKGLTNVTVEYLPGINHFGAIHAGFEKRLPKKGG